MKDTNSGSVVKDLGVSMAGAAIVQLLLNKGATKTGSDLKIVDFSTNESQLIEAFGNLNDHVRDVVSEVVAQSNDLNALSVLVRQMMESQDSVDFLSEVEALRQLFNNALPRQELDQALEVIKGYDVSMRLAADRISGQEIELMMNRLDDCIKALHQANVPGHSAFIPARPSGYFNPDRVDISTFSNSKGIIEHMSAIFLEQIALLQDEKASLATHLTATLQSLRDVTSASSAGFDIADSSFLTSSGQRIHLAREYKTPAAMAAAYDKSSGQLEANVWLVLRPTADGKVQLKQYAQFLSGSFVGGTDETTLSAYENSEQSSILPFIALGSKWFWENLSGMAANGAGSGDASYRKRWIHHVFNETGITVPGHPLFAAKDDFRNLASIVPPTSTRINFFICGIDNELVQMEGMMSMALVLSALNLNRTHEITTSALAHTQEDRFFLTRNALTGKNLMHALDEAARRLVLNTSHSYPHTSSTQVYWSPTADDPNNMLRRLFCMPDRSEIRYLLPDVLTVAPKAAEIDTVPVKNSNYQAIRVNYDADGNPIAVTPAE